MINKKIILEFTPEEVKLLAYGAIPNDLKARFKEIAYYLDGREKIKKITLEEIKKSNPKAYDSWTDEEDKKLKSVFLRGCRIKDLANQFQRSTGAIRCRLFRLGLIDEDYPELENRNN